MGAAVNTRDVDDCCGDGRAGYDETFGDRFVRRVSRRYDRHGLDRTQRRIVAFLADRGIEGASVLEIGGGIGEIQIELLRQGAEHVTNTEISRSYEPQAETLLREAGLQDRVTRRFIDIAEQPDAVAEADVVLLHRVVCCYPDYERLLGAAGSHARRLVVFSHPPARLWIRLFMGGENLIRRMRGNGFRTFVHSPRAMTSVMEREGFRLRYRHRGVFWNVVGFER